MTLRQKINWWLGIISSIGGMASIALGFGIPKIGIPKLVDQDLAKAIVGFWILIPPLYFWFEWTFLRRGAELTDPSITDGIKHSHDLARNLWLALVLVLIAFYGLKGPSQ